MYKERMLRAHEVEKIEETLSLHQKAELAGGLTVTRVFFPLQFFLMASFDCLSLTGAGPESRRQRAQHVGGVTTVQKYSVC